MTCPVTNQVEPQELKQSLPPQPSLLETEFYTSKDLMLQLR